MASPARGAFILFEGLDRCGKSTQSERLVEHLNRTGVPCELWKFPDRTTAIGSSINAYLTSQTSLNDCAIHLLFQANRWEKQDELRSTLAAGTTVVCDRYAYSGVAYSAAKEHPHMSLEWCRAGDAGLLAPDLVFFLSMQQEQAAARSGFGGERYETTEFQQRVAEKFKLIAEPGWVQLDAAQSIEAIGALTAAESDSTVSACQAGRPLSVLWRED